LKKLLISISVVLVASLFAGPTAGGAIGGQASAAPLRVKIVSPDGRPRIKVARNLKVLVSCNNDCRARARLTLKTPINNLRVAGTQLLGAGDVWTTGIRLTNFGLRYLRQNFTRSVLKVSVTATEVGTGRKVTAARSFRFYR
jgi:hypothetical protein